MRLSVVVVMAGALSCAPKEEAAAAVTPVGSTWLKFEDANEALCGEAQTGCGGASRPLLAKIESAAFSEDGSLLGLDARFFHRTLSCDVLGCIQVWELVSRRLCYSVSGSQVAPATGCPSLPVIATGPTLALSGPDDGLSVDHNLRRAVLGLPNRDAALRTGAGAAIGTLWLGDIDAILESPRAWDLSFLSDFPRPMVGVVSGTTVRALWPVPDGVAFSTGLFQTAAGLHWTTQADDVFALSLDEQTLQLSRRRVRAAITKPATHTVGLHETGSDVISVVTSTSTTTLDGIGSGDVLELSVIRTPLLGATAEPFQPFAPFDAHAPSSHSIVTCFTSSVDPTSVSGSAFSLDGIEVTSAGVLTTVPNCVRLQTAPLPRNGTLVLRVDGIRSLSGEAVRGWRLSVLAPDTTSEAGIAKLSIPSGVRAVLPRGADSLLVSTGHQVGHLDLAGVEFVSLGSSAAPLPGLPFYTAVDESAGGIWVSMQRSAGASAGLVFEDDSGLHELGSEANAAVFALANDGTLITGSATTNSLMRFTPTTHESVPRVTSQTFRGVFGSGAVLREAQGRFEVVTLPDTLESRSFAKPAAIGVISGPAFESNGVVTWCAGSRLYRLGTATSDDVGACREMVRDPQGVLWVTEPSPGRLLRIEGATTRTVTIPHPFDRTETLSAPHFKGGAVWFGNDTLRIDGDVWTAKTGATP